MPTLDSAAQAALLENHAVAWFIFLDIAGDPIRITTYGDDVTFSGTGDADLDGHSFTAFGGRLIDVGDVANSDKGSDTVTVALNGIISIDPDLANDIGDKSKWQGRVARIWFQLYDETGTTKRGALVSHYTGYMSRVPWRIEPKLQQISLEIENYLASTTPASNRSYLNQAEYDAADTSAGATIAAANGARPHKGGSTQITRLGDIPGPFSGHGVFSDIGNAMFQISRDQLGL